MSVERVFAQRSNSVVNIVPKLETSGFWCGTYLLKIDPTSCSVFNFDITELETDSIFTGKSDMIDEYGYTNSSISVPVINTAIILDPKIASKYPGLEFTVNFVNMNNNDKSVFVYPTATLNSTYINESISLISPFNGFYKSRIQSLRLKSNGTFFAVVSCGVTPWYYDSVVYKDMSNAKYDDALNPYTYQNQFFSGMAEFIDSNIVQGDKSSNNRLLASYWEDLGNDIFDDWGFFYLYDDTSEKYYFPILSPQNRRDGILTTQIFNAFGRRFTITHGWAIRGIFKFDISVNDSLPFRFGAYGNMGSDANTQVSNYTYPYNVRGNNLTLYYLRNLDTEESDIERFYAYWIPKKLSDNNSITYDFNRTVDDTSIKSNEITSGLTVYFSKTNDVKEWVVNNLQFV